MLRICSCPVCYELNGAMLLRNKLKLHTAQEAHNIHTYPHTDGTLDLMHTVEVGPSHAAGTD